VSDGAEQMELLFQAVERLRQEMREVVKVNRISWESADVEAASWRGPIKHFMPIAF
jgi:hypothetical protein